MDIANTIEQTRKFISMARQQGKSIGLVPTMGALHEGHLSLVQHSLSECDFTVVSIYVNPTQFGPHEDLEKYPRPFDKDCKACREQGVDLIFAPGPDDMYVDPHLTWIDIEKLGDGLCGQSRVGHFRGVCTVVAKLFNIVLPDVAYFGQKDAQQLAILRKMSSDLNFPIEIRSCPTIRESDGVAMSSRNQYLASEQRKQAVCLLESLKLAVELIKSGQRNTLAIQREMSEKIEQFSDAKIDYISIVDNELLQPVDTVSGSVLIAVAVWIGSTRLIDNIMVDLAV